MWCELDVDEFGLVGIVCDVGCDVCGVDVLLVWCCLVMV